MKKAGCKGCLNAPSNPLSTAQSAKPLAIHYLRFAQLSGYSVVHIALAGRILMRKGESMRPVFCEPFFALFHLFFGF